MSGILNRIPVLWEGAQLSWHSLAHVNRELCLGLLDTGRFELSLHESEPAQFSHEEDPRFKRLAECVNAPLSGPPRVHVRHFFPPNLEMPAEGHFVLIQPWEFGSLPKHWVRPIKENVAEIWCHSRYVYEVYRKAGIPADRLQIIPHGADTDTFNPEAPPYVFTT